jgi:two-component system nitrogen regulation sensor histidine kinase GlnL
VLATGGAVAENGVTLSSPRIGNRFCGLRLSPIVESDGLVAAVAGRAVDRPQHRPPDVEPQRRPLGQRARRHAGARGQEPAVGHPRRAQLLEQSVPDSERELTTLICEETDRIVALVDRMEAFAEGPPDRRGALNIHQVLNHVRPAVAERLRQERALHRELRPVAARRCSATATS